MELVSIQRLVKGLQVPYHPPTHPGTPTPSLHLTRGKYHLWPAPLVSSRAVITAMSTCFHSAKVKNTANTVEPWLGSGYYGSRTGPTGAGDVARQRFGLLGFNASATARVITRRWNDDDDEISYLVEETGVPGGNHRPTASQANVLTRNMPRQQNQNMTQIPDYQPDKTWLKSQIFWQV